MDIYLNLNERIRIVGENQVLLKDLGTINKDAKEYESTVIKNINFKEDKIFKIDAIEVIDKLKQIDSTFCVNNIGETEVVVEYKLKEDKKNKFLTLVKIFFLTLVLFCGSATTIMAFHKETGIPHIFDIYFKMFFGYESHNPAIIHIPYSFGLSIGIIGFFNHFLGKSFDQEPTPMEIEMFKYDSDLNEAEKKALGGEQSNGS